MTKLIVTFCVFAALIYKCNGNPVPNSDIEDEEDLGIDPVLYVRENVTDSKMYLVIDDMVISKDSNRAGLLNSAWPNAVVPYTFAMTIVPNQRLMITQAIAEISTRTCIQFRPANSRDTSWILFQNDPWIQGCSSYVGWQNRKNQPVQLSNQCSKGNAMHETIHALGFFHEQTKEDRDNYVIVHYENVIAGYESNFKKDSELDPPGETSNYDVPYNYDSIMHYGKTYFSKNGKPTIEIVNNTSALGNGDNIGQREYLSAGDIQILNKKYNCPTLADAPGQGTPTQAPQNPPPGNNPLCPNFPMCIGK